MSTMIRFSADGGRWLAAVDDVLGVQGSDGLRALPDPAPGIAGVIDRDGVAIPVVQTLSADGRHVLIVAHGDAVVGVLADEVSGVDDIDPDAIGDRPAGQSRPFVRAVHDGGSAVAYVLDAAEIVRGVTAPTGGGS